MRWLDVLRRKVGPCNLWTGGDSGLLGSVEFFNMENHAFVKTERY